MDVKGLPPPSLPLTFTTIREFHNYYKEHELETFLHRIQTPGEIIKQNKEDCGWIECDDCERWYHSHCLPDDYENPDVQDQNISNIRISC